MAKYRVNIQTIASANIDIEVPDDMIDPKEIAQYVLENADYPTICAQCSGWGQSYGLELVDDWEVSEYDGKPLVERA